jgi:ABC-type lipoprotein export system ATPase subunit
MKSAAASQKKSIRGSLWHRWDPHLHAPGTLLNDQFNGDWHKYIAKINSSTPPIRALGVTDYFCIKTYRAVKERWKDGELPGVLLVFPNVEVRLDIKTDKKLPVNLHLLFSPDDPLHEAEIERILGRLEFENDGRIYQCTPTQLAALGRAVDPLQVDDHSAMRLGAQQFKVTLDQMKSLFRTERWLRENCLVAVAGSSNDGTAGLQADDSYVLMRREIERFADIIFASTPSQRAFWLGKRAGVDAAQIERTYGALRPCLHGSDGHSEAQTATPSLNRFCWIKGDLSFESLRQVLLEPERRVWIGETPPLDGSGTRAIDTVNVQAAWLSVTSIALNSGLVAIIGARGSGKSALVEMIAHGAGCSAESLADSSFLSRAEEHLSDESVTLTWADGDVAEPQILRTPHYEVDWLDGERVRYLSQRFVERLCSETGLATELRREIERVVYESLEQTKKMETSSFDELIALLDEPIRQRRNDLREEIEIVTHAVVREDKLIAGLKDLREDAVKQKKSLENARKDLANLIPKDAVIHATRLARFESALTAALLSIERLQRRKVALVDLRTEVKNYRQTGAQTRLTQLQSRFPDIKLTPEDWQKFLQNYSADVDVILNREIAAVEAAIDSATNGKAGTVIDVTAEPSASWPTKILKEQRDSLKVQVGIDAEQQKKYDLLQREVSRLESLLAKLEAQIAESETAGERRKKHIENRRLIYRTVFESFQEEEETLNELYAPLKSQLAGGAGALGKLRFVVERNVDVDAWVNRGKHLLDLRKASVFKGDGALKQIVESKLAPSWRNDAPEAVSNAMQAFIDNYRDELVSAMPSDIGSDRRGEWIQSLAAWLYDSSHIEMIYSLRYDNTPIEKLSPGTRGIVLLLLYLVLDKSDLRPLIIDQPEENLDPKSVFDELVPHFREARGRRQVIIVTHNANLVVNSDADQVIVASAVSSATGGLPTITYSSGSLENSEIRAHVCAVLEGGERAFRDRAKRYRFGML